MDTSNLKIIKKLGSGLYGTAYLCEIDKKLYVQKIQHIMKKDTKKSFNSFVWREIDFANIMSSKYPQQFMKIFEYENKKCDYIHKLDPTEFYE